MKKQDIQSQILSLTQIGKLFSSVPNDGRLENALVRAIMEVLFSTGMTAKELVNLKKKDVDFTGEVVHIHKALKKERIVDISPQALRRLQDYLDIRDEEDENSPLLFVGEKGRKISPFFIGIQIRKYLDLAGINPSSNVWFLRHTFAVHALKEGMTWKNLQATLGHSSSDSTKRSYKNVRIPA